MASIFDNQIGNRNFLSPIGFKFTVAKNPKISFFSNSARIPEITLGTAIQPSYLKMLDTPGEIIQYGDFSLRFFVDEDMENYMAIHNWITGLPIFEVFSNNRIVAGSLSNFFMGTDLIDEQEEVKMWYSIDNDEVRVRFTFKAGVQVAFPGEIVYFTL